MVNRTEFSIRTVIIDDFDSFSADVEEVQRVVFNLKSVQTLYLIGRRERPLSGRSTTTLRLEPLSQSGTLELFQQLLKTRGADLPTSLLDLANGYPQAIQLIARLLERHDASAIESLLQGTVYSLQDALHVPERKLITAVKPKLITVNEQILERLRKRPQDIHQIGHRKFEELIAELLQDMNFDVHLTQSTRDEGRDVLAYLNSPIGRYLILVEAKKYRPDRKVGVQLVRTLYGTFMHEQANGAMLVTTSDFSPDARKFEAKHHWQLGLRNYSNLVEWIDNYKKPKPKGGNIILP